MLRLSAVCIAVTSIPYHRPAIAPSPLEFDYTVHINRSQGQPQHVHSPSPITLSNAFYVPFLRPRFLFFFSPRYAVEYLYHAKLMQICHTATISATKLHSARTTYVSFANRSFSLCPLCCVFLVFTLAVINPFLSFGV